MSEITTLTVPTAFADISQLAEGLADRVDDERIMLYGPDPVEDNAWVRFAVLLGDQSVALEGVGRSVASIDGGEERPEAARYDIVLDQLQFDGMAEVVYERILMVRSQAFADAPATGEVDLKQVEQIEEAAATESDFDDDLYSEPPTMVAELGEFAAQLEAAGDEPTQMGEVPQEVVDALEMDERADAEASIEVAPEYAAELEGSGEAEEAPELEAQPELEPVYAEPEPGYAEPEPEPAYAEPEPAYAEPEPAYAEPEPEPAYAEPEPAYAEPEPAYAEPEPAYAEPDAAQEVAEPEPAYAEPEPALQEVAEPAPVPEEYAELTPDHEVEAGELVAEATQVAEPHAGAVGPSAWPELGTEEVTPGEVEEIEEAGGVPASAPLPQPPVEPPPFHITPMSEQGNALLRGSVEASWHADAVPPLESRPESGMFAFAGGLPIPAAPPRPELDPSLRVSPAPRPGDQVEGQPEVSLGAEVHVEPGLVEPVAEIDMVAAAASDDDAQADEQVDPPLYEDDGDTDGALDVEASFEGVGETDEAEALTVEESAEEVSVGDDGVAFDDSGAYEDADAVMLEDVTDVPDEDD